MTDEQLNKYSELCHDVEIAEENLTGVVGQLIGMSLGPEETVPHYVQRVKTVLWAIELHKKTLAEMKQIRIEFLKAL
jgi:ribosomal protein L1